MFFFIIFIHSSFSQLEYKKEWESAQFLGLRLDSENDKRRGKEEIGILEKMERWDPHGFEKQILRIDTLGDWWNSHDFKKRRLRIAGGTGELEVDSWIIEVTKEKGLKFLLY